MMTIERQERVKYSKISNHPQTICGMAVSHGASRRSLMCLNNQMGVLVKPWPGNVLSFLPCFPSPPPYSSYPRTALFSKAFAYELCVKFYVCETLVKTRS